MIRSIPVICAVFADGTTFFTDQVEDQGRSILTAWRSIQTPERLKELEDAGVMHGLVMLRMRPADYFGIQANNSPLTMRYVEGLAPGCGDGESQ